MFGVQVAVLGITCLVVIVLLVTSPWWMRGLSVVAAALWHQVARTDADVIGERRPNDIVEGEFREVEK